jgi:HAMP domain-containing protein
MLSLRSFRFKKRKILLINPKFQLAFLAHTLAVAVVAIGVFYAADLYFFWKFQQMGASLNLPADHGFYEFLREQKMVMNVIFGVTAGVSLCMIALGGLFLSHRVAGPLYRLDQHMKAIAENRHSGEVKFRQGDFFQELAASFNRQMRSRLIEAENNDRDESEREPVESMSA